MLLAMQTNPHSHVQQARLTTGCRSFFALFKILEVLVPIRENKV